MEFKNSFLSWLFRTKLDEDEEEQPEIISSQPAEGEAQPEKDPRHTLELPHGHALNKLWAIYYEQSGGCHTPELALEGKGDPLLPEDEAIGELMRLRITVNTSANKRFELLQKQAEEEGAEEDGKTSLPDLDAQAVVFLARDCLTAWVLVYPPVGTGREVDQEMLDQALAAQGVCCGVDTSLIKALPQAPERYFRLFAVARGVGPKHGADGYVLDIFPRTQERKLTVDAHNRVDYANVDFIHNVEKDGIICRITPPTEGIPGQTVQGKEIPAKDGKPAVPPKGRNTVLSEDGRALLAAINGHVEFNGRGFQVKPVLNVPGNVDFSVGNINFLGDVCINGDICSGFIVRATGSITVGGVVEACTVEAGRDLLVSGGIQGDKESVIRAQRSIFAKFMENSCVYARESLEAECIINCDVYCDGIVTVRSGYRSIIGGKIHAAKAVSAGTIGSRAGNRIDIVIGGQPCDEFDYEVLTKEIEEIEKTMEQTENKPDSPDKTALMPKLSMQLVLNREKLKIIDKERQQRVSEPQDLSQLRMECDTVFPGTVLTIGEAVQRFEYKTSSCTAFLIDDEIHII